MFDRIKRRVNLWLRGRSTTEKTLGFDRHERAKMPRDNEYDVHFRLPVPMNEQEYGQLKEEADKASAFYLCTFKEDGCAHFCIGASPPEMAQAILSLMDNVESIKMLVMMGITSGHLSGVQAIPLSGVAAPHMGDDDEPDQSKTPVI